SIGDKPGEAHERVHVGQIYRRSDRSQEARGQYQQALSLFQDVLNQKDPHVYVVGKLGEADAHISLFEVSTDLGDMQKGRDHLQSALGIYRDLRNNFGVARALTDLGWVYMQTQQTQKALEQ